MSIRTILVDDEQPARDDLRYLLSPYDDIEIVGEADSASAALALIRKSIPDLVFLDIQMPGKSGFDIASELSSLPQPPIIVFATAYDNYAVEAFEKNAVDYILKPLSEKRLHLTISRIRQKMEDSSLNDRLHNLLHTFKKPETKIAKLSVEKDGKIQLFSLDDISHCQYEENQIQVFTVDGCFALYSIPTMDRLEEHLDRTSFFRIHRATIVNLDWISEFSPWFNGKYNIVIRDADKTELTVSRLRVKEFKQRLGI